jgi:hypothetical protein
MKTIAQVLVGLCSMAVVSTVGCASGDDGSGPGGASADVVSAPPGGGASQTPPAATTPDSGKSIDATQDPKVRDLSEIISQQRVEVKDAVNARLFELGGGDPAMNGDRLYLSLEGNEGGGGGVFDLGININEVKKIEATAKGTIHIVAEHDVMDNATGNIKTGQPYEATVLYTLKADGSVAPQVHVKRPTDESDVKASTDGAEAFLGQVFDDHQAENKAVKATVYSTGGGDVAMNGVFPFLMLANDGSAHAWDLGLNIAGITKVEIKSATEIRIEGREDFNPSSIQSRPVFYSVKFSVSGDDSELDKRITLTKLAQ